MLKISLGYVPKAVESLFITNSDMHKYNMLMVSMNLCIAISALLAYTFGYYHLDINVTLPKFNYSQHYSSYYRLPPPPPPSHSIVITFCVGFLCQYNIYM